MRPLIAALICHALLPSALAAATFDYGGQALTRRQAESLMSAALRAPGDSAALARGLGRVSAALQGLGYLDARSSASWDTADSQPRLALRTLEGPRYRLASVALDTGSRADSMRLARALGMAPGDWASAAGLGEAIRRAVRAAGEAGFPYAQLSVTQFDWDSAGARVRLSGSLGPEVTVSGVRFEGLRTTQPAFAERAAGPLAGRVFDPVRAELGRERLLRLGLFRGVEYRGLEGEGDWTRGRLVYRVEEPRYNRFEGAVGMQREGPATGVLRLELGNLAGRGRSVGMAWQSSGEERDALAVRYLEPLLAGTPMRLEAALEHQREDSLFVRARFSGRLSFPLPGNERLEAGYEQDRVIDRSAAIEDVGVQTTLFALERDRRDAPIVPRRGSRVRVGASQSFKSEELVPIGTRKSTASAADGLWDWHLPIGRRVGVAWQLSAAGRFSSNRVLAIYERYPLGGAATLRGFDEQAFRVDRFALSRLEWRWFAGGGGQHLALFWDHAWTYTLLADSFGVRPEERQHDGIGVGIRVENPGGLIGVDYGLEPGRPTSEGKLHLRLVTQF